MWVGTYSHIRLTPLTTIYKLEIVMNTWLTIAIIVVVLWAVGFFALPGVGSLIHILLVIAVILLLVWLFTGKKL